MYRGLQLFCAVLISMFWITTAANAADWVVTKVSQPAYYAHGDNTWKVVRRGLRVPVLSWIHTGKRGRVMLRRGADTIIVQPDSMTGIGGTRNSNSRIAIRHQIGKVLLDIRKSRRPRVKVHTKHLTAVVKGTVFSVSTTKTASRVAVERGLVTVTDTRTGRTARLDPGNLSRQRADLEPAHPELREVEHRQTLRCRWAMIQKVLAAKEAVQVLETVPMAAPERQANQVDQVTANQAEGLATKVEPRPVARVAARASAETMATMTGTMATTVTVMTGTTVTEAVTTINDC